MGKARQKVDDHFFSRRPLNTGQNYQINHSNPQKCPLYNCLLVLLLLHPKIGGQGSGLGVNCPPAPTPVNDDAVLMLTC